MNAVLNTISYEPVANTLGHVGLQYANKEDGPLAARLLEMLGYRKLIELPFPNGNFYEFVVDQNTPLIGDGIMYLGRASDQQLALRKAIHESLHLGQSNEHPAVAAFRAAQLSDPEVTFHVGVLMQSLEQLEQACLRVIDAEKNDPAFKGRIKFICNRSRRGDPKVDARMDASPIFGKTPRETYGRNGCQAFIVTDLISTGLLGENIGIELDYVFPGYPEHLLNKVEV